MNPASHDSAADRRLEEILHAYLQAVDAGQAPDRAALLRQHPDLAAELAAFFASQDEVARLAGGMAAAQAPAPAANDAPTLAPGETPMPAPGTQLRYFGDYELLEEIARGGMGVVYRARQVSLHREVALKMILAGQLASPQDVQRFHTEAEAAANLDHPNIVPIYEISQFGGLHYFSMKLIESGSLGGCLERFRSDARTAVRLLQKVARAVHYAHQRGILHRDLKPANILLDAQGEPHVTDFGLAKRVEGGSQLTQSGAIVGTPAYMAPEQARADKGLSTAVDTYSLGAILYELLTGQAPFRAASPLDIVLQVLEREPLPPSQLAPGVDRDLETICLKCLDKDPAKRYASAEALAEELQRWLQSEPIQARRAGRVERLRKWVRRRPAVAALLAVSAAALLAVVGGGIAFTLRLQDQVRQTETARDEATDKAQKLQEKTAALNRSLRDSKRLLAGSLIQLADSALRDGSVAVARSRLDDVSPEERFWDWHYLQRQVEGSLFTLYGHTDGVRVVAASPDGERLASGGEDGALKVWDARTGKELLTVKHKHGVMGIAFSPDGARLASGSFDGRLTVWDARTGKKLVVFEGHSSVVYAVAFSPDGSRLASSGNQTLKVWNARTGKELLTLRGHNQEAGSLAWSPDGRRLASGGYDQTLKLWDAITGKELRSLPQKGTVRSVAFSPDGSRLAFGADGPTGERVDAERLLVHVLDADGGKDFLALKHGAALSVNGVAFSPDGTRLGAAGQDGTLKVWDARTGAELLTLRGHTGAVHSLAFSPDGARLVSGSWEGTVKVWDARTGQDALALQGGVCVAFSPDGGRVATVSDDRTIRVLDVRSGRQLLALRGHTAGVLCVAYSADGALLASGSGDPVGKGPPGEVLVWDARTGQELHTFRGHGQALRGAKPKADVELPGMDRGIGAVTGVAFSPDGSRLASASGGPTWLGLMPPGEVKVWDVRTGKELLDLKGHGSVAFSPDGTRLVSGSVSGHVKVWDARTGKALLTLSGHSSSGGVGSVAWSPDGTRLVSGGYKAVKVWDADTGRELLSLKGHNNWVSSLSFSRDGGRLVSGDWEKTIKVWDPRTGQELLTFKGWTGMGAPGVALSPDGTRLAAGSWDDVLRIWDGRPRQILHTLKGHSQTVSAVAFSPDSARLASGSWDDTVKVWEVATGRDLLTLQGHTGGVTIVAWSPDGTRLASCSGPPATPEGLPALLDWGPGSGVKVWDARTGKELLSTRVRSEWVGRVAFSPDSAHVVVTSASNKRFGWDVQTGQQLPEVSPLPDRAPPALSPDGRYFARTENLENVIRLIDLRLSDEELTYRRRVTSADLGWHAGEGLRFAQAGEWFAATFHLRQRLRTPAHLGLRRDLALCQLGAGQEPAYRETCAALLEELDGGLPWDRTGLALLAPSPEGVVHALPSLTLAARLEDVLRPRLARAIALGDRAIPAPRLLRLADGVDVVTRALLFHRAGKHDDAVKLLADQSGPRAQLVRALAEQARGRPAEAARALAEAATATAGRLPWDERLELDLLKREAESLLKPPPGK